MAIGGSHTWNYDQGVWKETKEEPDLWKIDYRTDKRRARKAPTGSGAPVGTEYHWFIVGHQVFPLPTLCVFQLRSGIGKAYCLWLVYCAVRQEN